MRVLSHSTIINYYNKENRSKVALENWYQMVKKAEWTCFADIKKDFNSVDNVGNQRFVFDIKGNDYRLVAIVRFSIKTVFVRFVGTHKEYDKIRDIKNI